MLARLVTDALWWAVCARVGARELELGVDVEIRSSKPAARGLGVYACRDLRPRELVARYTGRTLTLAEHELEVARGSTSGSYAMRLGETWVLDGEDAAQSGFARYINHSVRRRNCEVVPVDAAQVLGDTSSEERRGEAGLPSSWFPTTPFAVYLVTTRAVAAGEELQFDYGGTYWREKLRGTPRLSPRRLLIDYL